MTRLSIAIRPPRIVLDRIAALPRPPRPGLNWSMPEQWIVKLRPLGHVPDRLIGALGDALTAALDGAPAPECLLGPATVRPGGQWLYAPVAGLDELADEVFAATEHLVPVTHPQPYVGALVLARGRVPADVAGAPVDAAWQADTAALVADRSAPGRPRAGRPRHPPPRSLITGSARKRPDLAGKCAESAITAGGGEPGPWPRP